MEGEIILGIFGFIIMVFGIGFLVGDNRGYERALDHGFDRGYVIYCGEEDTLKWKELND